jgi:hypothetical protein
MPCSARSRSCARARRASFAQHQRLRPRSTSTASTL